MYRQAAQRTQHTHNDNESRTQARIATRSSSDSTANKRASTPTAASVTAIQWSRMVAPKPRSRSSSDVDAHLLACRNNHSDQRDDDILGTPPWLPSKHTTQTSVAVDAMRPRQLAGTAGIHRRLCFSLDEKALFDLHNAQYSSTTSQQQLSSDQSPQRMATEPIEPPFAPPERVRTPDGVPSWPGVVETSACTRQQRQRGHTQEARKKRRGGTWSKMKAKFLKRDRNSRGKEGRGKRIRRALSFRQWRQEEPRTFTPWRPPMSGHSTFRFEA